MKSSLTSKRKEMKPLKSSIIVLSTHLHNHIRADIYFFFKKKKKERNYKNRNDLKMYQEKPLSLCTCRNNIQITEKHCCRMYIQACKITNTRIEKCDSPAIIR